MHSPVAPLSPSIVRLILLAGFGSLVLAAIKITTGVVGNSYALVADGIESLTDLVTSIVVLVGLILSLRPPDDSHPWGHGKYETFATAIVSLALFAAASAIAWQAIQEIRTPHEAPAWFTLPVLLLVVAAKVLFWRALARHGRDQGSTAMEADSWHHLSDALTSGAAFVGISLALLMGPGWEAADDWAALLACSVILWNGARIARGSFSELLESRAPIELEEQLRTIAGNVRGVRYVEKMRARKSGLGVLMDIHVEVDGHLTVIEGHDIAREVKGALLQTRRVTDVTVHVEPHPPAPSNPNPGGGPSEPRAD